MVIKTMGTSSKDPFTVAVNCSELRTRFVSIPEKEKEPPPQKGGTEQGRSNTWKNRHDSYRLEDIA